MDAAWSILSTIEESQWAWVQGKVPKRSNGNFLDCLKYLFSKRIEKETKTYILAISTKGEQINFGSLT